MKRFDFLLFTAFPTNHFSMPRMAKIYLLLSGASGTLNAFWNGHITVTGSPR